MTHRPTDAADARLERVLGELMVDRDPGSAPYGLDRRVEGVTDEAARPAGLRSVASGLAGLAGLAAAAVLMLAVIALGSGAWRRSPATGSPVQGVEPGVNGAGVVPYPQMTGVGVAVALLVGVLVLAGFLVRWRRGRGGWLLVVAGLGVGLGALALATFPGARGSEHGGSSIWPVESPDMPVGFVGQQLVYVIANPGEPFQLSIAFENAGPLPVTVLGMAGGGEFSELNPHWTEVLFDTNPEITPDLEGHVPFTPTTLAPGESVKLRLVGAAGPCAVGAAFSQAKANEYNYTTMPMSIVWSIAGWERATPLESSYQIQFPGLAGPCAVPQS